MEVSGRYIERINFNDIKLVPVGVLAPSLIATSATSITISWGEPIISNGEIIIYKIFM